MRDYKQMLTLVTKLSVCLQVSMPQPGTLGPPPPDLQLTGQASGQIPGRSLSAGQLPPPNGAVLSGQATGQLAGRTVSAGQLPPPPGPAVTEQRTGQLAGQAALQPPGQMFPARRTGGNTPHHLVPYMIQASVADDMHLLCFAY